MLAGAMAAMGFRTAVAVIVLTTLVCVVAVVGDGPLRGTRQAEPYTPSRSELKEIGAITSEYPVPGQLPPELFPPEAWGLHPPGPPAWLLWALGAIGVAAIVLAGVRLAWILRTWRIGWRWRRPGRWRWRRRVQAAGRKTIATEPAREEHEDEARVARQAVDAALAPLREAGDPRAAVIEAYAQMEHVLAERQLGRRAPEAPREYLGRIMREHGMPEESLTTLTALFEEARFSRHPIPESAPRRAVIELRTARDSLIEATHDAEFV